MRQSFCSLLLILLLPLLAHSQTLRFYHIDVEQASATLVIAPNGKSLLVDCGEDGMGDRVWNVMQAAGISNINYFVLTHYHKDHYGGIDELVDNHGVTLWQSYDRGFKNQLTAAKRGEKHYKNYQRVAGEDAVAITPGFEIPLDSTLSVTCVSSSGAVIGDVTANPGSDENDNSVSLMITYRGFRYFVGGDIEEPTESKIAAKDLVQDVDVYVANHHGSHSSTSHEFITDLSPRVVVISNGNRADYQHPRLVTLQTLSQLPVPPQIFQTNKVSYTSRGGSNVEDSHIADPETDDDDGTIEIEVDGSGHYTVSYGANSSFSFNVRNPVPSNQPARRVVIEELLPNPIGSDEQKESVTLRNKTNESISISGWKLVDRSGYEWELKGNVVLAPGAKRVIVRSSRPMSLNNSGDEIRLFDGLGELQDSVVYEESEEGVGIRTGH